MAAFILIEIVRKWDEMYKEAVEAGAVKKGNE